jgi:hypothetical protein
MVIGIAIKQAYDFSTANRSGLATPRSEWVLIGIWLSGPFLGVSGKQCDGP